MLLFDVTKKFDLCVDELCKNEEPGFLRFIKDHERRTLVLNNLSAQVLNFENNFSRKKMQDHAAVKRRVNQIVAVAAQLFIHAAKKERTEQNVSDIEKIRRANEANNHDANDFMHEVEPSVEGPRKGETEIVFD